MMLLSERIKEERKKAQLSQEQLADKVGVSRQTIYKWENDQAMPDLKNLKKLAETFNVSVENMLDEEASVSTQQTNDFEAVVNKGERLIKRHWRKGGYVLIYYGLGALVFAMIAGVIVNSYFSTSRSMMQGFGSSGYMNMGSPFGHFEQTFMMIPILVGIIGLGLLIGGGILVIKDKKMNHH